MVIKFYQKFAINILLFLTTFFIILVFAEVILSTLTNLKKNEEKIRVKIGNNPGHCYTSDKYHYFPLTLNDPRNNRTLYCLQYDVLKRQKGFFPERKIQFALIGDSFTFGEGVKSEDTLAYLLGEKFTGINFRNYGMSNANVLDVYRILSQIVKKGKPKSIIYFYNLNDALMSKEIESQQKFIIDFQNIRWLNYKETPGFFEKLLSHSALYSLFKKSFILHKESKATVDHYLSAYSDKNKKELTRTLDLLTDMNELLKKNHIGFGVIIYPLLYKDIFGRYPFVTIHQFLLKFCAEHSLKCVDALATFSKYYSLKKFTVHAVDYHPNGDANKQVATHDRVSHLIQTMMSGP